MEPEQIRVSALGSVSVSRSRGASRRQLWGGREAQQPPVGVDMAWSLQRSELLINSLLFLLQSSKARGGMALKEASSCHNSKLPWTFHCEVIYLYKTFSEQACLITSLISIPFEG